MRGFFFLLEDHGPLTLAPSTLREHVSPEAEAALRACGVVRAAPRARSLRCDLEPLCFREVLDAPRGASTPCVAVCRRDPPECDEIEVTDEQLAQVAIAIEPLHLLLRSLFAVVGPVPPARAPFDSAIALGEQSYDGARRDVFFLFRPDGPSLPMWLSVRERAERSTLVLVSTGRHIDPDVLTRHAPGAKVEVARLEDRVVLRSGQLTALVPLHAVAPIASTTRAEVPAIRPLPPYKAWKDLHFSLGDGHTLLVRVSGVTVRRTYFDLGMAHKSTRNPTAPWKLLAAVCNGRGKFDWKEFGDFGAAKTLVSELQRLLRTAFGIADNPFEKYRMGEGWRPNFRASPGPGGTVEDQGVRDDEKW